MNSKEQVIRFLKDNKGRYNTKEITIGIDSAIDKIVRVVHSKSQENEKVFFTDIAQFGNHIVSKSGVSCGIEISERFIKLGGNAPIMSNALGTLGVKVNCVSPLGLPEIDPIFKSLSSNCDLYSIGNPACTTAIEFEDGKIMLAQVESLDKVDWKTMKEVLGLEQIKSFFDKSNLIGLVNWSCMINFNNIFEGILTEVLAEHKVNKSQIVFFDLSDFSKRGRQDICQATELVTKFNDHYKVILGLNENEAILVFKALLDEAVPEDLLALGQKIFDHLNVDDLVVHTLTSSIAWNKDSVVQIPSLYVREPKLSTGGGDNFNAGLCFGQLLGLDLEGSLYAANATSGYYVRNAQSPSIDNLIETLENWDKLMEFPK
jgi:hypothetical protein